MWWKSSSVIGEPSCDRHAVVTLCILHTKSYDHHTWVAWHCITSLKVRQRDNFLCAHTNRTNNKTESRKQSPRYYWELTCSQNQCCTCCSLPVPSCCSQWQSSCCMHPHLFKTICVPHHVIFNRDLNIDQNLSQLPLALCPVPELLQHHQVSVDSLQWCS